MSGDALAVALELLRAPSMRIALRQRPLPTDVGELIELAAGESGRVERAAAKLREAPERVLEAARFYVREVLLFAGADAYRVLGVAPCASAEQIKLHHRLLQHWLHPDRRGNESESAFATRINAAWSELRLPERRAAYDGRQPSDAEGFRRMLVNQWRPAPVPEPRNLGWLVATVSAVFCVWLVVLVNRQATAPAPEWKPVRNQAAEPELNSIAGSFQKALENAGVMAEPEGEAGVALLRGRSEKEGKPRPPQTAAVPRPKAGALERSPQMQMPAKAAKSAPGPTAVSRPAYTEWVDERRPAVVASTVSAVMPPQRPAQATPRIAASPGPAAPMVEAAETTDLVERVSLLRRRTSELLRYLGGASGPAPPIWRSVAAQDRAVALRTRLGSGRVRFGEPAWRIASGRASMTTLVRTQRTGAGLVLRAEFVWRNDMWLVETLHIEDLE